MRTTLTIADDILVEAKRIAAEKRCTVSAVVNDALRVALKQGRTRGSSAPFEMPTYGGAGVRKAPGISPAGMAKLGEEDELAPFGPEEEPSESEP